MNSMKRQKYRKLKDELPRLVGAQYATGEQWRNNSRKNEETEPKQKQHPVVDVTGDGSKVQCCKEQYCIGTWNARSMNQGKLQAVDQEMARVNIDILGISELKWTGVGEFNSNDHYIYYCGQESIRSKWSSPHSREGNGTPLQYSCLENPMDGRAWKAAVHGVAEGRTRLSDFTFTFHFHALEKEMATHSSVLAWRIPGTEEPGGLPSMGSHRVGHD